MRRQTGRSPCLNVNPVGFIVHINRDIKMCIRAICHTGTRLSDLTRSSSSNIFLLLWVKLKSFFIYNFFKNVNLRCRLLTVRVIFQYLAGGVNRFVKGVGGGQISDYDNRMFDYLSLSVSQVLDRRRSSHNPPLICFPVNCFLTIHQDQIR